MVMPFVINVIHNVVHNVIFGSFKGIYDLFQAIMNDKRSQFSVMNGIVNDKMVTIF